MPVLVSLFLPSYPCERANEGIGEGLVCLVYLPGADLTRQRMDEAGAEILDSDELWEKAKSDTQMRSEAFRAAHDRAAGRSREEVRDIHMAELRSRGLAMPSESALDAAVERIMGDPLPSARLMGEGLIETGKLLHGIFKIFWHATGR